MSDLQEITAFEQFYYRLEKLQKELDLLMRDVRAFMPERDNRKPEMALIDSRTGKPYKKKEKVAK